MGEFEQYTVEELSEMVAGDRPAAIRAQAEGWATLAALLTRYSARLSDHRTRMEHAWTGAAAGGYSLAVAHKSGELEAASSTASGNAAAWHRVADAVEGAQAEIARLNRDWQTEKQAAPAQEHDTLREPFDAAARRQMDRTTVELDGERGSIADHAPLRPVDDFPADDHTVLPGDEDPPPDDDPRGPELQSGPWTISGPPPNTSIVPHCPGTRLPFLPPPPVPAPANPPPRTTPPPPPRSRPTPPPARQFTPRTAPTVRPVIGARPGTTGMAPATPPRTPGAITAPVIGTRPGGTTTRTGPGALTAAASRSATPAGRETGAEERHRPGTVDEDFWTPPTTLPAVIRGTPDHGDAHDPGPVALRRPDPADAFTRAVITSRRRTTPG